MATTVVNKYRHPNVGGVNIMRPGPWGNPYVIGRDGTREEVIRKFEYALATGLNDQFKWMRENAHKLKGHTLICCCKPQACHGDILAALAEAE